ncbi:putative polyol transporter 2 [Rhodamnia argentea]|uniref:Polyol transporter 2 n=1 Tax=Rhodamnia argentea TaxID=178133 RepID=A0A8B8P6I9_9MYRT|nr:putative polyol transporter 2 [Rhodamnia argentea]
MPSVVLCLGVLAMSESLKWLIMKVRLGKMKRLFAKTSNSEKEVVLGLVNIKKTVGILEECNNNMHRRDDLLTRLPQNVPHHIEHNCSKLSWAVGMRITTLFVFVPSFSIRLGRIAGLYNSGMFPQRLRAHGYIIDVGGKHMVPILLWITYLSLSKAITLGGTILLFAGIMILVLSFDAALTMTPCAMSVRIREPDMIGDLNHS